MLIIEVNHITKKYQLDQLQSLKISALNQWRRLTGQPVESRASYKTLGDVTFLVEQNKIAGIICKNEVGKSNENWCLSPLICFRHSDAPSRN
jgi:ABC-type polysaccharide/polyol phosphate transport system ATPase subunit